LVCGHHSHHADRQALTALSRATSTSVRGQRAPRKAAVAGPWRRARTRWLRVWVRGFCLAENPAKVAHPAARYMPRTPAPLSSCRPSFAAGASRCSARPLQGCGSRLCLLRSPLGSSPVSACGPRRGAPRRMPSGVPACRLQVAGHPNRRAAAAPPPCVRKRGPRPGRFVNPHATTKTRTPRQSFRAMRAGQLPGRSNPIGRRRSNGKSQNAMSGRRPGGARSPRSSAAQASTHRPQ
jgi:hypothetical protein